MRASARRRPPNPVAASGGSRGCSSDRSKLSARTASDTASEASGSLPTEADVSRGTSVSRYGRVPFTVSAPPRVGVAAAAIRSPLSVQSRSLPTVPTCWPRLDRMASPTLPCRRGAAAGPNRCRLPSTRPPIGTRPAARSASRSSDAIFRVRSLEPCRSNTPFTATLRASARSASPFTSTRGPSTSVAGRSSAHCRPPSSRVRRWSSARIVSRALETAPRIRVATLTLSPMLRLRSSASVESYPPAAVSSRRDSRP